MITSFNGLALVFLIIFCIGMVFAVIMLTNASLGPFVTIALTGIIIVLTIVVIGTSLNMIYPSEDYCNHIVGDSFETYMNAEDHFCDYNYTERHWHYNETRFKKALWQVDTIV